MKLHIVDGTHELFRAFHASPPAKLPDGRDVGALRGLLRSLLAFLHRESVTHAAIAFDAVDGSFRNRLFGGYAHSRDIDPRLLEQQRIAHRVAQAVGLVIWQTTDFEAEDAMATAAARWSNHAGIERIVLCSPSARLAQCVRGCRVVLLDRQLRDEIDSDRVIVRWGAHPSMFADYLALIGDPARGVPALPGWDAESARRALTSYGCFDDIPDALAQRQARQSGCRGVIRTMAQTQDHVPTRLLTTLRTDVPLAETLDDLEWKAPREDCLKRLCEEIGEDYAVTVASRAGR